MLIYIYIKYDLYIFCIRPRASTTEVLGVPWYARGHLFIAQNDFGTPILTETSPMHEEINLSLTLSQQLDIKETLKITFFRACLSPGATHQAVAHEILRAADAAAPSMDPQERRTPLLCTWCEGRPRWCCECCGLRSR